MGIDGLVAGQGNQYNQNIQIEVQKKAENVQAQQMQQIMQGMEKNLEAQQKAAEMMGVGVNLDINA